MNLDTFDYNLPKELIAQKPHIPPDECRLFVYNKKNKSISHKIFKDIIEFLSPGDLIVLNNTKVIPAKLSAKKESGGSIGILLIEQIEKNTYYCFVKGKIKHDTKINLAKNLKATIIQTNGQKKIIKFDTTNDIREYLYEIGSMPLPPYIKRKNKEFDVLDKQYYQTVFAEIEGSIAAPTASLHFTSNLLDQIKQKGVQIAYITLHVGLGTFKSVETQNIQEHKMHEEYFEISAKTAQIYNKAKLENRNILPVGTTVVRALESASNDKGYIKPTSAKTDIFIYPGYKFKTVNNILTNFHLPKSTLIMLVAALIGIEDTHFCYKKAIEEKYRFFSYGDAFLVI
ncbi:S-adenosylmethionine:tRNA ribosyltransferase-isomerase [Desulfurella multipotens]|uniref:S-adenosylmethionine:tRNA ribosyltransferase-isomerase n=1 Tax=Desulfurella multipotens TaxID=79269 RepID=A0A1G6QZ26_9BACT|nr:tRNA preQ1(34) S-adenosylmethionine ribosyltransferase-isomerase QueA [Desulfurella multipotens]SDC97453.1 S-adenosylmethionine:tRNA ribosyltransferase-isomerase [Desulfurella multipotens]